MVVHQIANHSLLDSYTDSFRIIGAYCVDMFAFIVLTSIRKYTELNSELNFWRKIHDATSEDRNTPPTMPS